MERKRYERGPRTALGRRGSGTGLQLEGGPTAAAEFMFISELCPPLKYRKTNDIVVLVRVCGLITTTHTRTCYIFLSVKVINQAIIQVTEE